MVSESIPELRWAAGEDVAVVESAESLVGPWNVLSANDMETGNEPGMTWVRERRSKAALRFYRLRMPGNASNRQPAYDIGQPSWRDVWVDGVKGEDYAEETHDGTSRTRAFRTLGRAWRSLPETGDWPTGYRIRLVAGRYRGAYLEDRRGTWLTPVLVEPADGPGTVTFTPEGGEGGNLTFFRCSHVYLQDFGIDVSASGGDGLQFEACDHVLLRRMTLRSRRGDEQNETLKVNQSRHVYVEDCDISGAGDNCVDMVAVQHGHVVRSRIHDSVDWAIYLKGGSAYFRVESNEIYGAGTGGFTAGQGSGVQWMVPPWIHYEAYDVKVVNNWIHDTEGAGLGVNGGYNILLAHNTLYRVGSRSHVMEFVFGGRTCDGRDTAACQPLLDQGAWGQLGDEGGYQIPNRNVLVANNVIFNPAGFRSQWQHFQFGATAPRDAGFSGPDPARADAGLVLVGNVLWNGPADHAMGNENASACGPDHPSCSTVKLLAENAINQFEPDLVAPSAGDARPRAGGLLASRPGSKLFDFTWVDAPTRPVVPAGDLRNEVLRDFDGRPRTIPSLPGAFLPRD
jgi:hypothetical protein